MFMKRKIDVRLSVLSKLIYRFNVILTRIAGSYFMATDKQILKFIWRGKKHFSTFGSDQVWQTERQKTRNSQHNIDERTNAES